MGLSLPQLISHPHHNVGLRDGQCFTTKWRLCSPATLERVCFPDLGPLCLSQVFRTWEVACEITDAFHIVVCMRILFLNLDPSLPLTAHAALSLS